MKGSEIKDLKSVITKKEFASLFSEDISKRDYDRIIEKIDKRFVEICDQFLVKKDPAYWFDYCNGSYSDDCAEGYFDPVYYKDSIGIIGENIDPPPGYDFEFPTRWLWEENFQDEVKAAEEKERIRVIKLQAAREEKKRREEKIIESIRQKLTAEELKFVKFYPKRV